MEKDEANSERERLETFLAQSESVVLGERKARQFLTDENFTMQLTIKEFDKKKVRMAIENASLKERLRKKASLKLAVNTISDPKQRVSQFLHTALEEIVMNSFKEALKLAYADNIDKSPKLSFLSLDSALVGRVMGKINRMKQEIRAAEDEPMPPRFFLSMPLLLKSNLT